MSSSPARVQNVIGGERFDGLEDYTRITHVVVYTG